MKEKFTKGFTLIELLVVISIIGVLAALVLANFNAARERAHDVQRKSDLDQVKKAVRMYYNDNNQYPINSALVWNSPFQSGTMVYMKVLPQDPSAPDKTYTYEQTESGQNFLLKAVLDNHSDGEIQKSQIRCLGAEESPQNYHYVVCAD